MAFKGGVVIGTVSLNATGSGTTGIGNISNTGTIAIGNAGSGAVSIDCGVAGLTLGTTLVAHTTTMGSTAGASTTNIQSGSGGISVATSSNGPVSVTSGTGTIDIGSDATANTINIGSAAADKTINIGFGVGNMGIRLGVANGTTSVDIQSGSGGATLNSVGGSTTIAGSTGVTVNSAAGTIGIGDQAAAQPINIGTGAAARTITIGNNSGATALQLTSGTGSITLTSTGTGDIILDSDDTMLLDADGVLELNSSAGAISIGNDADSQAVNIGTAGTRTVTIGSTTSTSNTVIRGGTGASSFQPTGAGTLAIGTTNTGTLTMGNTTGTTSIQFGTGSALSTFVDWTSWTPVVSFGGASVGITYSTQTGFYSRIGNIVTFYLTVVLTSKGSSVGNMVISGLPLTVNANTSVPVVYNNITYAGNELGCLAVGGTGTLIVYAMVSAGAVTQLADTNMANNSSLFISGMYRV